MVGHFAQGTRASYQLVAVIDRVFAGLSAARASPHYVRAGPFRLRWRFASAELADAFLPSCIHGNWGSIDLDIAVTSSAHHDLRDVVPNLPDVFHLVADSVCYAVWQPGAQSTLLVLDRRNGRAVLWLASGEAPPWVKSRPALALIHALSIETPYTALHSGAVGLDDRFILLAGKGRSGKTTAALSCAKAGWCYAGDDFVFVDTKHRRIEPIYCSARLRLDLADLFREYTGGQVPVSDVDGERRHEISLARLGGDRLRGGELKAIFLPRRLGATMPEFTPARRGDAFAALMAATTIELPGWPRTTAEKIAAAVELAPVFFVDTGTDPAAIPDAFAEQLNKL